MSDQNVTIGMLKDYPEKWNIDRNWSVFVEQFEAHGSDTDIFITPECYYDGYAVTEDDWTLDRFASVSLTLESERIADVRRMAKEKETAICFGFTELREGGFYNCALLVDRSGDIVGTYHKTHLQTHDVRFHRGEHLSAFDLDCARVGMVICADRRWPESIRALRLDGAKICLMPTYGMSHEVNEWWMRTRSYENQMFVCFTHPGVSLITDPGGKVAAKLQSNVADVLVHTVDLSEVSDEKHLIDRRPDLYGILSDTTHSMSQKPFDAPTVDGKDVG